MTEPTLKELLNMKDPGKYLYKFIKKNPGKYPNLDKNITVFENKWIDPISWIYQTIIKDNKKYFYIQYSSTYIKARNEKSSKSLWKLMKSFNKDSNKWKKRLRKEFNITYASDIYVFTALSNVINPEKFSYFSKQVTRSIGMISIDTYIKNIEKGNVITYDGDTIICSFNNIQ